MSSSLKRPIKKGPRRRPLRANPYKALVVLLLAPPVDYKHNARGSKEDHGGDNAGKNAGAAGEGQAGKALYVLNGVVVGGVEGVAVGSAVYKVQRGRRGANLFRISAL